MHSSGKDKGALDPFQPERPEDIARLEDLQRNVHDVFIGVVKERRAGKLKGPEEELFSGTFWSAAKASQSQTGVGFTPATSARWTPKAASTTAAGRRT